LGWEVIWVVAGTLFTLTILLRLGLLAYVVVTLFFLGLFTRGPAVTLDLDAWNVGTSFVTLLVLAALAVYGFTVALAGRPAFGGKAL
jgi:hypothetical protein